MTQERAFLVSDILVEREVSHTIQVGVHPTMCPAVAYRIDLHLRPVIEGGTLDWLNELQAAIQLEVPEAAVHISTFPDVGISVS